MNLSDLTISGVNQVSVTDSIAAPLFKLKIERSSNTVEPVNNQLVVFVDKSDYANPTDDLRRYVYDLSRPLKFLNNISDKFVLEIKPKDNDIVLVAKVERYIEDNDGTLSQLATMEEEILESFPICLFEGVNYIYTNYTNALIEVIYPKNNDFTKLFLNNAVYYNHKIKNDGEFSLDDIYFKDAFTKTEDKLNLEVNNASIDCLSSRNNNFSLDEEGNLIVNSISSNSENLYTDEMIVNLIYPTYRVYQVLEFEAHLNNLKYRKSQTLEDFFFLKARIFRQFPIFYRRNHLKI